MNQRLEQILAEIVADFHAGRMNCAESVLLGVSRYFGWEADCVPRIATPFGGGLGGTQHTCGALSGGVMAIGLRYGRAVGGDKQPSYDRARELVEYFQRQQGALDCRTVLGLDFSDPEQAQAFRAPGGKHQTLCEQLVPDLCRHLVERMERDGKA